jgi:choline-sulfatase
VDEHQRDRWTSPRLRRIALGLLLLPTAIMLGPETAPGTLQAGHAAQAVAREHPPNLLLLIADDHRGGTLGIDGDPRRATPRLDQLAGQGVRFTRAYCNSPVCTPSRQSFITGRLPHAIGVTRLATPLPDSARTLGDLLVAHGFDTAAIGKMHFNSLAHHGFKERIDLREYEAHLEANPPAGGDQRRPWRPFKDPAEVWLNARCLPEGLLAAAMDSAYFADQAIDYLRSRRDTPFALVVSFYDPHSPFKFPREWAGRYRPEDFSAPAVSDTDLRDRPKVFQDLTDRHAQGIQAAYYTSLSFMDHQVGRVLDALDAAGLADDTVVVYLGDNGYMLGEHGRFEKHCFYEPAVRVPLIVRWPGRLPRNRRVDEKVELVDLLPTVLDLLGVERPSNLHGQSLVPLLNGTPGARGREVIFSEYFENEEAMIRNDQFKLIVGTGRRNRLDGYETGQPLPGPYERLFDVENDPAENTDLADRPELAAEKARLLSQMHKRLVETRDGALPVPRVLSELEAIHWCLVPRDPEPEKKP